MYFVVLYSLNGCSSNSLFHRMQTPLFPALGDTCRDRPPVMTDHLSCTDILSMSRYIQTLQMIIGLYHDVWIAAIASSRTRLATLTGAMCKTSQCELRSLRVNSGMLNVIRIVTYYTLPPICRVLVVSYIPCIRLPTGK